MLRTRMRKASASPSMRAPSGVAVPVRRATCPSTASRASATLDRVTSAVIDTVRLNESATRPVTPAISTSRVRVTQSAGCSAGWSLRPRAATSSPGAAAPVASPAIQAARPRPAVTDPTPSRTAVAAAPRTAASQVGGSTPLPAILIVGGAPSSAGLSAGLMARTAPPLPRQLPSSLVGTTGARSRRFTVPAASPLGRGRPIELFAQLTRVTGVAPLHSAPAGIGPAARRFGPLLLRLAAGVTVLWFLGWRVGAAPFENGLRAVTWPGVAAAVTLTALTTVCSAWRWRVVARALGAGIGLPAAAGAYYRSLFLNSVLPGGVLGDVHRAVVHGRRAGDVALGLRAVVWERLCGQVIQAAVTAVVLLTMPSPVRPALPYVLAGIAGVAGCAALVVRGTARRGRSRLTRGARAVAADLRHGLLAPGVWPQVTVASVLVVAGHTATFVIAARIAGCTAPLGELVALLMVVQTAAAIPLSIGGWGPREGIAAWAFAAAGLGAATGVPVATLYAVLMPAAGSPGGGPLLRGGRPRRPG